MAVDPVRLTVAQAAQAWGISKQRVLVLCATGRVNCTRFGKSWVIHQEHRPPIRTQGRKQSPG